ncbi:sulfate/molybdate ABC transporter ATP-binding protein [Frigoribacterium sp. Leaf186]|uniref:sulfate/molybdate ABC transporter ATP-binding protein n=1 Tax=Frigoribacterium sp. Leaf186 TaxID=1736293 RepID=UPI0006F62A3D|nr:ATP-binding cassette domain-containing protein [Frigoribacterium sp. Leaf186]KQS15578.1 molybdenum ABC transporter ATP-binding protein [Frigoribacterium sp. Leaf186]
MTLEFAAVVESRGFDVQLTVAEGETLAVLGPNGAGKSTLLALIAGLLRPDHGTARLAGRVLFDVDVHGRGPALRPHERGVSMLAQDALLFPHLSALDNVAFGPRSAGVTRREADRRAGDWLARVDATDLAGRRPAQLSGGQSQRIAVARALAADPDLLLLDEPMAALDVSVAPALRRTLRDVLADRTAIVVTHDVLDAFTLADRVVVLEGGRVVDAGPTRAVLERPTTPFAAGLAALNLLTGTAAGGDGGVRLVDGTVVDARAVDALVAGAAAAVAVRPSAVRVTTGVTGGRASTENVLDVVVTDLEPRGDLVRVRAGEVSADVPPGDVAALDLAPGTPVRFSFDPDDAVAYPL